MARSLRIATLVKSVLVEAIRPTDDRDPDIQFRIDIFSWSEQEYSCQVWRLDTYRVQPTFASEPSQMADDEWFVLDHGLSWRQLRGTTAEEVLAQVFVELERQLGVKVETPAR
jgi:hypothetical protein